MSNSTRIDYRHTGFFSKLICDYLAQDNGIQAFYHRFPMVENFEEQIAEKQSFSAEKRKVLVKALQRQYEKGGIALTEKDASLRKLNSLAAGNTYTVTTGHQLNVFTGPLYFLYKIVSVINSCKQLKKRYPASNFVPVYWMATEDHDFEEINHIHIAGGKLQWDRPSGGAVGKLSTEGFEELINELAEHLGASSNAQSLIAVLRESYQKHTNLADATRYLVHQLFAEQGLVIIDGDDKYLKQLWQPFVERDVFENAAFTAVRKTSDELKQTYFEQVFPREINHFYLSEDARNRIEKDGDQFVVLNTDIVFTEEALRQEIESNPQNFSPNAILRPLYQEVVLPNLAYVGGGGELAYWLQLKDMFAEMDVPFPMLMLRNSALWVNKKAQNKLNHMGMKAQDLFEMLEELKNKYVEKHTAFDLNLEEFDNQLVAMFKELEEIAEQTDKSMLGAVNAQHKKQQNGLANLRKKLLRAEKRRLHEGLQRIENLYLSLFPNQLLQERYDNFSVYYAEYGPAFIEQLLNDLDPFDFRFSLVHEKV